MLWCPDLSRFARSRWTALSLVVLFVLLALAASAQITPIQVRDPVSGRTVRAVDGRIIVLTRPGAAPAQMQALFAGQGSPNARRLCTDRLWLVQLPAGTSVQRGLAQYAASPLVQTAEPDVLMDYFEVPAAAPRAQRARDRASIVPNDTLWPQLWGMQKINAPDAWDVQQGDPSVVVAIIDSGTDFTHPDLAGRQWVNPGEIAGDGIDNDGNGYIDDVNGWDFFDNDNDPSDTDVAGLPEPHGTHVAGTAGAIANNSLGVVGVTWGCQIMPLRVGNALGLPRSASFEAITYAADNGADTLNMSYGGGYSSTYDTPIGYAYGAGVVCVAAAGNSYWEFTTDPGTWMSPVCNDGVQGVENKVIGVAATDQNDIKADFSNYSGAYSLVDVAAPGVDILSTVPGGGYESWPGTSMAAPHVTGLAGLVVSDIGKDMPDAVINQIRDSAVNIDASNPTYAGKLGKGRIDAAAAVGLDLPPAPATAVSAFDTPGDEGGSCTITWRRSRDDGSGADDVTGYELWRGEAADPATAPFERVADRTDLPPGSSGWIDTLNIVDGTSYYYFVRTFDASNQVDSTVAGPAVPRDDLPPPAIDTLVAKDTPADDGRSITLTWSGYDAPDDVIGYKVYRSQASFTTRTEEGVVLVPPTVSTASDGSSAAIALTVPDPDARTFLDVATDPDADPSEPNADVEPFDFTDYYYAVTAVDEVGNEVASFESVGPVKCAPNLSLSFGAGLQLITIPAVPADPKPMSVFGLTDPSQARFARYDPLSQAYRTLDMNPDDPFLQIAPGRGFWLDRPIPSLIGVAGVDVEDPTYEVPIEIGWNAVGSPYDAEHIFAGIAVRDAVGTEAPITASNQVRNYGWYYDSFERSYKLLSPVVPNGEQSLPARHAVWVYSYVAGAKLIFTNPFAPPPAPASESVQAASAEVGGWQLRLVARTDGAADTDNFLGVCGAADEIGKVVGPPPVGSGIDLYFPSEGTERLAADFRDNLAAGAKWDVAVECGVDSASVVLSWPDLSQLPDRVRPVLTDAVTGKSVYMRTASSYEFRSGDVGQERLFTVSFADPAAGPVMTQLAAAPTRAGGAEVTFRLSRAAAQVEMRVLNVAGRPVATVPVGQGDVGLNRVVWNGLAAGHPLPSGRYVIEVTATAADNGEQASALSSVVIGR